MHFLVKYVDDFSQHQKTLNVSTLSNIVTCPGNSAIYDCSFIAGAALLLISKLKQLDSGKHELTVVKARWVEKLTS